VEGERCGGKWLSWDVGGAGEEFCCESEETIVKMG